MAVMLKKAGPQRTEFDDEEKKQLQAAIYNAAIKPLFRKPNSDETDDPMFNTFNLPTVPTGKWCEEGQGVAAELFFSPEYKAGTDFTLTERKTKNESLSARISFLFAKEDVDEIESDSLAASCQTAIRNGNLSLTLTLLLKSQDQEVLSEHRGWALKCLMATQDENYKLQLVLAIRSFLQSSDDELQFTGLACMFHLDVAARNELKRDVTALVAVRGDVGRVAKTVLGNIEKGVRWSD